MQTAIHQDYRGPQHRIDHEASLAQKVYDTRGAWHCELKKAGIFLVKDENGSLGYEFPDGSMVYPLDEAWSKMHNLGLTHSSKCATQ
jgi:hypothetical protein